MKEEQVQREVPCTHLQRKLGTDKAEVSAKLQHEIFHAVEQSTVEVVLGSVLRQAEKFDGVGVPENARRLWMYFFPRRRHFYRRKHGVLEKSDLELPLQLAFAPLFLDSHVQIELALLRPFALSKVDEVVRPEQLSGHWPDNCVIAVSLVELPHSEKVIAHETALPWLRLGNVLSQLWHDAIAPLGGFDLAADVLAYPPVKIDQRNIDGLKCPLPSGCNEADNIGKARFPRYASLG